MDLSANKNYGFNFQIKINIQKLQLFGTDSTIEI